jgi:hypothetical protein
VDLVEVDVVGLQALQAGRHRVHDVPAARAPVVGAGAHLAEHLGGDNHVLALRPQVLQRLPEQSLGLPERIDVGGVEEVHPGLEGAPDDRVDLALLQGSDRLPHARALGPAEGHGPQADLGDEQTRAAKLLVLHETSPVGAMLNHMDRRM